MRTCVVLNPKAGSVEGVGALREALDRLPETTVRVTEEPGDAERFAREALEAGCDRVVSAGGDGTLNQVVNGLAADFGRVQLGILPLGTGNDFARSVGVPAGLEGALAALAAGRVKRIDVARAEAGGVRHFLNTSAGGFSGVMSEKMDEEVKRSWGPLSYLRTAVEVFPERSGYETIFTFDGNETVEVPAYNVVVSNARYVASGIPVAPHAVLDDGRLDVMIVPVATLPQLAVLVPSILLGRHLGNDLLVFRRAARVEIESRPPMPFNVDGEPAGETPARFDVLPRALAVVVGPGPEDAG